MTESFNFLFLSILKLKLNSSEQTIEKVLLDGSSAWTGMKALNKKLGVYTKMLWMVKIMWATYNWPNTLGWLSSWWLQLLGEEQDSVDITEEVRMKSVSLTQGIYARGNLVGN